MKHRARANVRAGVLAANAVPLPCRLARLDPVVPSPPADHVVITAADTFCQRWQARISHWRVQKMRREHPGSALGGYTRLLDSDAPDELMGEIPTFLTGSCPPEIPEVTPGVLDWRCSYET